MKLLSHEEARHLLAKGWMTNQINKAAVRSMAAVEIRRLTMVFAYRATGPKTIRWDVGRCFAFNGVTGCMMRTDDPCWREDL